MFLFKIFQIVYCIFVDVFSSEVEFFIEYSVGGGFFEVVQFSDFVQWADQAVEGDWQAGGKIVSRYVVR